jgi:plastocyanin
VNVFRTSRLLTSSILIAVMIPLAGCGDDSPTSPSPGTGAVGATVPISSTGVSPKTVTINSGEVVMFVNSDSQSHQIASDPHPSHTDCPAVNALDVLAAGQSRSTGNFTTARTCGYHDHRDPTNTALQGTITIR